LTTAQLGTVVFPVSCAHRAEAVPARHGSAHSFWYEESRKKIHASIDDPNCAMAHWGIAMSLWHQLWNKPDAK